MKLSAPTRLAPLALGCVAALVGLTLTLSPVRAQNAANDITLTAIPPRLGDEGELKAKPGEKLQTSIKVRNTSSETLQIKSVVQDFILSDDGETPVPLTESTPSRWSLASWIILAPDYQVLNPGQTGLINVIIDIPADALPGGHYAMITHQPTIRTGTDNPFEVIKTDSSSAINQRVGSLLYVVVDGPINEQAFVRSLTIPRFTEYGPVPFSLTVDNQSDIHIKPQITVEIRNIIGQKVDSIQLEPKNVFPLMSRQFSGSWDRVWGAGWYSAKVIMSYGSQGQIVIANTSFWLLPITLVIAGLIIITVLSVIGLLIRRHLIHRRANDRARVEMLEQRLAELEKQDTQNI